MTSKGLKRSTSWQQKRWQKMEWYISNGKKTPPSFGKPLVKKTFFKSFPQNPGLDLIWRIHLECGFYGFIIRFGIWPNKRTIRIWIFPKTRTLRLNDIKKQLGMFFNIFIILSKFAIQHSNHMASMSQWNSLQIGILNGSNVSTHWISIGEVSVLDFKKVLTPGVFCSNFNLWNKGTVTLCNSFALCN